MDETQTTGPVDSSGYAPYVGVWLQWAEESDGTEDVTWCQDKVNDDDTLYLRADCVAEALAGNVAAIEALKFIITKEDRLRELIGV